MAAVITKLQVDEINKQILISAKSSGITVDSNNDILHHKFTNIFIDTTATFNCKDEHSRQATKIQIPEEAIVTNASIHEGTNFDGDLVNFAIPFDSILSDDVLNDLLFVWVEETEYNTNYKPVDLSYYFGIVLATDTFYEMLLNYIKINSADCCNADCSDVNFMLAWQGFKLSKTLQDYKQMIYYWSILHEQTDTNTRTCNCR